MVPFLLYLSVNNFRTIMQQETFIVGSREFTCIRMNPSAANKLVVRLQKTALPIMGSLMNAGKKLGDVDVQEAAKVIASHLDEALMDSIVFPLFTESRLYCVDAKKFVKSETDIDHCFTTENLFDLYELIFEVARYQFSPFFARLVERFGALTGNANTQMTKLQGNWTKN